MKKRTILILGLIMGCSFLALLSLQVRYIEEMVTMRREQFDESVKRSLYEAAHKLELYETMRYLEKDAAEAEPPQQADKPIGIEIHQYDFKNSKDGKVSSFEMRTIIMPRRSYQDTKNPEASAKVFQGNSHKQGHLHQGKCNNHLLKSLLLHIE